MSSSLGIRSHCSPGQGPSSPPSANPLLQKEPQDCLTRARLWGLAGAPLLTGTLSRPSQGGCPKITPNGALCPQSCPALGFSCCSRPTSQLSRRVEAFPRGLEAPGCSSLRPRGRPSPTPTSLLATAGLPRPLLCIFSLGGGLGAGNPAHILSPPSLGGRSS